MQNDDDYQVIQSSDVVSENQNQNQMIQLRQCLQYVLAVAIVIVVVTIVSGQFDFVIVFIKVIQEDAVSTVHSRCFASNQHANCQNDQEHLITIVLAAMTIVHL